MVTTTTKKSGSKEGKEFLLWRHARGSRRPLEGERKRMRHVKLRPGKELNVEALSDLIEAAYHDIRRRLSSPLG